MNQPGRIPMGSILARCATRQIPFLVLFYVLDYYLWSSGGGSNMPGNDAAFAQNLVFYSLLVIGFFAIDFGRQYAAVRNQLKNPPGPPPQVVYVPQPIYVPQPPPGNYPQQGYYQQYPPPPPAQQPAPAQPRDPRGGSGQ